MTYMYNGKAELEFLSRHTTENRLNPDIFFSTLNVCEND